MAKTVFDTSPILTKEGATYEVPEEGKKKRLQYLGRFKLQPAPNADELPTFSVHLKGSQDDFYDELDAIYANLVNSKMKSCYIGGDFNCTPKKLATMLAELFMKMYEKWVVKMALRSWQNTYWKHSKTRVSKNVGIS